MGELLDGNRVAAGIRAAVREDVRRLREERGIIPFLAVVQAGDDPASAAYVGRKQEACAEVGINSWLVQFPAETPASYLGQRLAELSEDGSVDGILLQLPLPGRQDPRPLLERISPDKDVDGLTSASAAALYRGDPTFVPCTPKGILSLLDAYDIATEGANVAILGRSDIVGKPLALLLSGRERNATVSLCHSRTADVAAYTRRADIVVTAVGRPRYLTEDMVREGAVVVDVGITRVDDPSAPRGYRLAGDADFAPVRGKARYITPVPGGVGPLTVASLLQNTLLAYRRLHQREAT